MRSISTIHSRLLLFLILLACLVPLSLYAATVTVVELELNKEVTLTAPKDAYDTKALENRLSKYYFKTVTPYVSVYKVNVTPDNRYTLKIVYPGDKSLSHIDIIGENPYSKSTALITDVDLLPKVQDYTGSIETLTAPYTFKSNFTVNSKSTGQYVYLIAHFAEPSGTLKVRISSPAEDDKTVVYSDTHTSGTSNTLTLKAVKMPDDFQQLKLKIDSLDVLINGTIEKLKVAPFIQSNTTLVPLRYIGEKLGAKVEWSPNDQKATYTLGSNIVEIWIGKTTAQVNGKDETMALAPKIVNGNTVVPLRFIAEKLGASVQWFEKTKEIIISY